VRAGWKVGNLDQLCEVFTDGDWIESKDQSSSGIRLIQTGNVGNGIFKDRAEKARYISEATFRRLRCTEILEGDCLVSRLPDPVGRSCLIPQLSVKCITAVDCTILRFDQSKLLPEFFNYFSQSFEYAAAVAGSVGGATRQRISRKNLGLLQIPLPPLDEQRKIVAVLDKAFAAIATATATAQQNLTNARALFESYLRSVFDAPNDDWQRANLGELTSKIGSGATPRGGKEAYKAVGTPLIRSMNVHDRFFKERNLAFMDDDQARLLNNVIVREHDVLLNITGASVARCCLAPRALANARVNQHVAIIRPHAERIKPDFLELALTSPYYKDILLGVGEKGGSTRQAITKAEIQALEVSFPSIDEQNIIIEHASDLQLETQKLSTIAEQKIAALAELKQSLLQEAFAGELTATVATAPAQSANDNFATPQFTAQVIAFAHRRHEQKQKQRTFGHVKAQKTLHLVESVGGIDLGRQPIRDAAGPNDFQHMLSATDWAAQQGFFAFTPRANGVGYDFNKLANYDACMTDAVAAIQPVATEVTRAIDLIVETDSTYAELIATTHAAWNNLIRDQDEITDDAIVLAARDNWHTSKLQHDPSRFHDAIRFIRTNAIVPDGTAKYVGGQASLF
jgi:restriction endonuclease S subunit